MTVQEIKSLLKSLFDYYAMRSGQISCESLKSKEFHKLIADAAILKDEINTTSSQADAKKRIDLIFCSVTGNCLMTFD